MPKRDKSDIKAVTDVSSKKTGQINTSRNPFLNDDWVKAVEKKLSGEDDRIDYESLPPDQKRFLTELQASFDRIPAHEREKVEHQVEQYLAGEISWAEFEGYPPELLYEIAKIGQSFIEINRLDDAESLFKGLAIFDHKNYYYRGILGSIYQKKHQYIDALTEYSLAIDLNPTDIPSYANRGECWLKVGALDEAKADFEKAMALGEKNLDKWANRARILHKNLMDKLNRQK